MNINPKEFLNNWSAREFYHLVLYLSWEGHCTEQYQKIMSTKINK